MVREALAHASGEKIGVIFVFLSLEKPAEINLLKGLAFEDARLLAQLRFGTPDANKDVECRNHKIIHIILLSDLFHEIEKWLPCLIRDIHL